MAKIKRINWFEQFVNLLAVILGISIAFMLNNWADNKRFERIEEKTLLEMRNDLAKSLVDMKINHKGHLRALNGTKVTLEMLQSNKPWHDSLNSYLPLVLSDPVFEEKKSAYESLRSRGLELIKDDSLRVNITEMFEVHFNTLNTIEEDYGPTSFFTNLNPFFQRHFRPVIESGFYHLKPIDFTELKNDTGFQYALFSAIRYRTLAARKYDQVILKTEILITAIEQELNMND